MAERKRPGSFRALHLRRFAHLPCRWHATYPPAAATRPAPCVLSLVHSPEPAARAIAGKAMARLPQTWRAIVRSKAQTPPPVETPRVRFSSRPPKEAIGVATNVPTPAGNKWPHKQSNLRSRLRPGRQPHVRTTRRRVALHLRHAASIPG